MSDSSLETRIAYMERDVKHLTDAVHEMSVKLTEVHSAFVGAKGAKYVIVGLAMLIGAIVPKLLSWLPLVGGR